MSVVRHLAGADAIADDVGLSRTKFPEIVRLVTALAGELEVDEVATSELIARDAGVTGDQVRYVWLAWVRTEQHPAGRR